MVGDAMLRVCLYALFSEPGLSGLKDFRDGKFSALAFRRIVANHIRIQENLPNPLNPGSDQLPTFTTITTFITSTTHDHPLHL